jgi:site-specific DNA-methyltransferase (adenine-specific)
MSKDYEQLKGLYSSEKWEYETPDDIFNFLDDLFNFGIDCAANEMNTKCENFISPEMDALNLLTDWKPKERGKRFWLNPPWGREYTKATGKTLADWLRRAYAEYMKGNEGVVLVSARVDTRWWHDYAKYAPWVWFPKGRISFLYEGEVMNQPNFGSAFLIYVEKLTREQKVMLVSMGDLRKKVSIR